MYGTYLNASRPGADRNGPKPAAPVRSRSLRAPPLALALTLHLCAAGALGGQEQPAPARSQNPSPMAEHTRAHGRLSDTVDVPGTRVRLAGVLARPVQVLVPETVGSGPTPLLLHFHGASYVAEQAAAAAGGGYIVATVNLGAGTGVYERAFEDPAVFDSLVAAVRRVAAKDGEGRGRGGTARSDGPIVLSAFSAGHGAVRALIRRPEQLERVEAVLLLDGIHTGYVPQGTVLDEGGHLDVTALEPYARLALSAIRGDRAVLITHSEIFPGTFASTTETVDYLVDVLGVRRRPVLCWGPGGMQQLSETRAGRLQILGFAGNSAPDHIDHLHGMGEFLLRLRGTGTPADRGRRCAGTAP